VNGFRLLILLIDNYDSFVFNLARYFERLGQETVVLRNDATNVEHIATLSPDAIVISPGPCTPAEAGCSIDVVRDLHERIPILGICLGHQAIAAAFDAQIVRARYPMHGQTSMIQHNQHGVFAGLPNPLAVCRYHSLVVDELSLPDSFEVTARTHGGTIMAIAHRRYPVIGLQFHPEGILTECGYHMLSSFLRCREIATVDPTALTATERTMETPARPLPSLPVTF
jgi:anthranilate synthase/aminodeoxychorismate synthase-like glutamine amidotransferase